MIIGNLIYLKLIVVQGKNKTLKIESKRIDYKGLYFNPSVADMEEYKAL